MGNVTENCTLLSTRYFGNDFKELFTHNPGLYCDRLSTPLVSHSFPLKQVSQLKDIPLLFSFVTIPCFYPIFVYFRYVSLVLDGKKLSANANPLLLWNQERIAKYCFKQGFQEMQHFIGLQTWELHVMIKYYLKDFSTARKCESQLSMLDS